MKKILLPGILALAVLLIAGFGMNRSMNSYGDLSDMALKNVLALADGEDPEDPDPGEDDGGGDNDFKCSLTKDECEITVTLNLIPILKEKFNINVSVGVIVDLTDFTKVYAAAEPNKPKIRCGIDVFCNDLL